MSSTPQDGSGIEALKASRAGKGGDISLSARPVTTFSPGRGGIDTGNGFKAPDGDVILQRAEGEEIVRFCWDGRVIVRGVQVDDDLEIYMGVKDWLAECRVWLVEKNGIVGADGVAAPDALKWAAELAGDFDPFDATWSEEERKAGERALALFANKLRGGG